MLPAQTRRRLGHLWTHLWTQLLTHLLALVLPLVIFSGAALAAGEANIEVQGVDEDRAAIIRDHAERVRSLAFEQLLGLMEPLPWHEPCVIVVHRSDEAFAAAVGVEPTAMRGATSLDFFGDRVSRRRIDVMGDGADPLPDALAHELVHVVLADHFSRMPPPRWADEGMAVLFDSLLKQQRHNSDLQHAVKQGQAWSAADLAALEDYPDSKGRQQVFYGQSAALVRWLMAVKGAATFIRFVDDSNTIGFSASLRDHYGFDAAADLEPAWRQGIPLEELVTTAGPLH